MAYGDAYQAGSVSIDDTDKTIVNGVGTLFEAFGILAGDRFEYAGASISIAEVIDDDTIKLSYEWPFDDFADVIEYAIAQVSHLRSDAVEVAGSISDLRNKLKVFESASPLFAIKEFGITAMPGDAAADDRFVVAPSGATGDLVGKGNQIVTKLATGLLFNEPSFGWHIISQTDGADENILRGFDGEAWSYVGIGGVNTSGSPTTGRLAQFTSATEIGNADVEVSTDGTLASNSDIKIPTEKAVKAYADSLLDAVDGWQVKNWAFDASGNPNYPAASAGHAYLISVAGKIGGASGKSVEAGDVALCTADSTASGNEASVGTHWTILQANLVGALSSGDIGTLVQAYDADLAALAALSSTGLAARTAANTWAQRTITGTANEISISNGDGVSGNPTLSLPTALTFTGKVITGGARVRSRTTLTILAGVLTVPADIEFVRVGTEGAAATDDLDTINITGGNVEGRKLYIRGSSSSQDVTFRHGVGNFSLAAGANFTPATAAYVLVVIFDGTSWQEVSRSYNA